MTTIELPEHPNGLENQGFMPQQAASKIRTLIVDDQLLQREIMTRLLRNEPDFEIVGTAANGREAVTAINELDPDLVFLDVQMPELDGFGVVAEMHPPHRPAVIFVTSEEDAAIRAFDVQALDYLLKSFSQERFRAALQRARDQIQQVRD